ncbi:MAG: hypothetical protein PHO20_01195 [Candidatus Peribacteraceae bacterium]|nr:hypothetical protein [Candidatus Peribacteraceae bacterium]MDD5739363.1 hypothetical protein [Candidatus Peribacteraceae bacterium]
MENHESDLAHHQQTPREAELLTRIGQHFSTGELEQVWQAWCNLPCPDPLHSKGEWTGDTSRYPQLTRAMAHFYRAAKKGTDPNDFPRSSITNLLIALEKDDERRTSGEIAEAIAEIRSALSELHLI